MVVPELLATQVEVPNAIRCKIIDVAKMADTKLFGDSGLRMVAAGFDFYFTQPLAQRLINAGIAVQVG